MKKSAISLFLVLAIIFSFASCTTASIEEETTVTETTTMVSTTLSSENLMVANSAFEWIDSVFELKSTNGYGGLRPSIADQINLYIQTKISENPDEGPAFYSIEYLSHPEGTEGFFQLNISFDATKFNEKILHAVESTDISESHIFIKGYSEAQIDEIISSIIKDVENVSESFRYEIIECDYNYCCLIIYN